MKENIKYFLFVIIKLTLCATTDAVAMHQDIQEEIGKNQPVVPTIHLLLHPEQMETINKMKAIATLYPQIAQEIPLIRSLEEFKLAKVYFEFTKQYNQLLFSGAVNGPTTNGTKTRLIEQSQHTLKGLLDYITTLKGPSCKAFRSLEDEGAFSNSAYETQYKIAQNHLMLLIALIMTSNQQNNASTINAHVHEIKRIKESLSVNAHYRKNLQESIKNSQELVPALIPLFNPQIQLKSQKPKNQTGRSKIEQQKTVNYYAQTFETLLPLTAQDEFQKLESFDPYFQINVKNILNTYLALSLKKMSHEEYVSRAQQVTEEYSALEKKGLEFKAWITAKPFSPVESVSLEDLTNLYRFFCQRYTLQNQNPLHLLENSIFMFIQANKVNEALTRTEALKTFLLEKGTLSDKFISLRASVMALNGDYEEWRNILETKKKKAQKEKNDNHQQQINQIKEQQERQKEQEKLKEIKKPSQTKVITNNKRPELNHTTDSGDDMSVFSVAETKSEILIPREKIKTRNPARESTHKDIPLNCNKKLFSQSLETPTVLKDYPLSQNAFKIYQKIRKGEWKFSRQNLSNLFQKLNCTVDFSQGKGCHGKISAPLDMVIMKEAELVAVIPEFVQKGLPFPLTIPDWDEKWSGIVPPYMRKSILKALEYLGATDETVHK